MAAKPMSPGTMLDGRYRLEVLLSEQGGARFWRATDTVLERSVAVHVVPSDDPRSERVLEAARVSAAVSDPHFLRVLDCADDDGLTWVINEWGDGVSLDVMLARGHLPAMRAAWLTREVAEAVVAAHAQGLCHGRLNPEAVLVTESGAVKLIGFVVNAAFERTPPVPSVYGEMSAREVDVVDLAGILYAALTGKWPGVSPSAVPKAPREGRRPLRPRQVRAGVPRDLDAICDRVLNKEASQHSLPIETAFEIAAALSDFVGDPALVAPLDAPSMHDEPAPPKPVDGDEEDSAAGAGPETAVVAEVPAVIDPPVVPDVPAATDPSEAAQPTEPAQPAQPTEPAQPAEPESPEPPARPAARAPSGAAPDPEETMASAPPFSPSGIEFFEPDEWEPITPLPPFEQPPERPLFAEEARRVPEPAPEAAPAAQSGSGIWESEPQAPPPAPAPRRRSRLKTVLVLAVALAVAVAMFFAFRAGNDQSSADAPGGVSSTGEPSTAPGSSTPSVTPSLTGAALKVKAIGDFDPEGDPQAENPGRARLAIDGDLDSLWPTSTYPDSNFGSQVSGVGLVLDLGEEVSISSIEVRLGGEGTDVRFYASPAGADGPPAELADAEELGRVPAAGTSAAIEVTDTSTRYLIIWLTKLPASGEQFRGQIAEITVRS